MRPVQSLFPLAVCLSSLVVSAAASPWPDFHWLPEMRNLAARQESSSASRTLNAPSPR